MAGAFFAGAQVASAAQVTVSGTDDIFAYDVTDPSTLGFSGGAGTAPSFVDVMAGKMVSVTAMGSVDCCDTASTPGSVGPDGFASNPFTGGGSAISGNGVTYSSPGAFALAGLYTDSAGAAVGEVFTIGSSFSGLAPVGADRLYLGLPDASGFNGAAGFYGDNSGSFAVSVSAAPEPASWALMIAGVGLIGVCLRRKSQSPVLSAA